MVGKSRMSKNTYFISGNFLGISANQILFLWSGWTDWLKSSDLRAIFHDNPPHVSKNNFRFS
ncbi:hypothetical protein C7450_12248 [Chelatococcus asaccharovorans]|uniref:Uncharacterized protein n=1 Tax=Chelatococcus asaccharovorans TaxID=28210 RepID=A0A2V3TSS5_9HYPH|nr:hypothetical protein C7450_12248 [Chelatococcus asaccharovorans]